MRQRCQHRLRWGNRYSRGMRLFRQYDEPAEFCRTVVFEIPTVERKDAPDFFRSATATSAASARSMGRSLYFFIESRARDMSRPSSGKSSTTPRSTISQSASCAFHEKPKRYIASVNAGQTVPNGSVIDCSVPTQRAWWASSLWIKAMSGPASTRIIVRPSGGGLPTYGERFRRSP